MTRPLTLPARALGKFTAERLKTRKSWRWLSGMFGLALAWQALRGVDWAGVWELLSGLGPLAILIILSVNLLLLPLMTARWWLLLRALGTPVGLLIACAYRMAANAVSYLTPGPHFGGEPLSVYLLHHRHGIPLPSATTSVAVDRLLELLASIVVLAVCLVALAAVDHDPFTGSRGLLPVIALPVVMTWFSAALFTGKRPVSRAVLLIKRLCGGPFPWISSRLGSLGDMLGRGEVMAASLFHRHRRRFLLANLFSMAHWIGVFAEFWLMSSLLGFSLSPGQLAGVVAVARLAFFTPLPAGIGVLESALPWATAALGLGSALGIGLCLIIRFRDLLFSLAGLGLSTHYLTCHRKASIIDNK